MRSRIARYLASKQWAITDAGMDEIRAAIEARDSGMELKPLEDEEPEEPGVALIRVHGPIMGRSDWFTRAMGWRSSADIAASVRAAASQENIKAIVLEFDTPGGEVDGVQDAANAIMEARDAKPVVGVVQYQACSAGYWMASQCSTLFATEDAMQGSIGVYVLHQDLSKLAERAGVKLTWISAGKNKAEGHPLKPLSDDAKKHVQAIVERIYERFTGAVARGRDVSQETAAGPSFGDGRVLDTKDALAAGMIDGVSTLREVLGELVANPQAFGSRPSRMVAEDLPPILATDTETAALAMQAQGSAARAIAKSSEIAQDSTNQRPEVVAAEENEMDETKTNELLAAVQSLTEKVTALSASSQAAETRAAAAEKLAQEAKDQAIENGKTNALAATTARLELLVHEFRLTPAEAESELELLADAAPEKVAKRLDFLASKEPSMQDLTRSFVAEALSDDKDDVVANFVTPAMWAADPTGAKILADAAKKAGGDPEKMARLLAAH